MKITINTDILKKHHLSLGEFLVMLLGYYSIDIKECQNNIIKKHLAENNLFKDTDIILSNNNKDLVAQILMESDDRAINSGIDFNKLAYQLQQLYPDGIKTGKTYPWRGTTEEIAQKLRILVVKYNFLFTPEEAINAVKEYLSGFETPNKDTHILKNFLLWTNKDKMMESMFMTIIENNRE
jgi:hypothetical protein